MNDERNEVMTEAIDDSMELDVVNDFDDDKGESKGFGDVLGKVVIAGACFAGGVVTAKVKQHMKKRLEINLEALDKGCMTEDDFLKRHPFVGKKTLKKHGIDEEPEIVEEEDNES